MPSPISFLDLSKFTANFTERQLITILNFYEKEVKYKIHQNDTREEQAFLSLDSKKKKKKSMGRTLAWVTNSSLRTERLNVYGWQFSVEQNFQVQKGIVSPSRKVLCSQKRPKVSLCHKCILQGLGV